MCSRCFKWNSVRVFIRRTFRVLRSKMGKNAGSKWVFCYRFLCDFLGGFSHVENLTSAIFFE